LKRFIKILIIQFIAIIGSVFLLIGFWANLKSVWEDFSRPIPLYWIVIAFLAGQIFYFMCDWYSQQQKETSAEPKEKPKETIEVTNMAEEPKNSPKREEPTRNAVRQQILPLMKQNKVIFEIYGPDNDYRFNPESEEAIVWKEKVRKQILPNNRKILAILDENKHLLTASELMILEKFRQHVNDLERRHLRGDYSGGGIKFPQEMETILEEIDDGETG